MRNNLIFILVMMFSSSAIGQTIHRNDIVYFVGCYTWTDSLDRERVDLSKFVDWAIVKPTGENGRREIGSYFYKRGVQWVYQVNGPYPQKSYPQNEIGVYEISRYRFYIFMDLNGHERQRNVLTVWQKVGRDSLRYVCGQTGPFDTGIGWAGIKHASVFPDSSILLVVDKRGEISNEYSFFRGGLLCDFKLFYNSPWYNSHCKNGKKCLRVVCDLEKTGWPNYQAVEVIEYLTGNGDRQDTEYSGVKIDSVKTKILNLWEIAQEAEQLE